MIRHEIRIKRARGVHPGGMDLLIRRAVRTVLSEERVDMPCRVDVTITDDRGIRELNRRFRAVDRPTDVLSFPMLSLCAGHFRAEESDRDPETGCVYLGDVVLSAERAARQAAQFGHSVPREAAYLTVHSVLHLLGYDHVDEGPEKARMRAREEIILQRMGLSR